MRAVIVLGLALSLSVATAGTDPKLPGALVEWRSWHKVTDQPQVVPYQLSILCMIRPPTAEDLRKHGPHTNHFIMVHANPPAATALADPSAKQFPAGSIIAKEKRSGPGAVNSDGVAFMIKHSTGEFVASGGWEFLFRPAGGAKVTYDSCIACHKAGAARDYVFGRYDKPDSK